MCYDLLFVYFLTYAILFFWVYELYILYCVLRMHMDFEINQLHKQESVKCLLFTPTYVSALTWFTLNGSTIILQRHVMLFLYSVSLMLISPSCSDKNTAPSLRHPEANHYNRALSLVCVFISNSITCRHMQVYNGFSDTYETFVEVYTGNRRRNHTYLAVGRHNAYVGVGETLWVPIFRE